MIARILAIVVILFAGPSLADPAPWSIGVSAERQARAQALLEEGNARFLDKTYDEALALYDRAIAEWDHPAIRFNIVRTLIRLARPVEAADNLALALRYGEAPLGRELHEEALNYQQLLATKIATVAIRCTQAGATVTLDGRTVGTCPGSAEKRIEPGPHQLVATLAGHVTQTREVIAWGGKRTAVEVELPVTRSVRIVRRYRTWIPWVVTGGGLVVAALGGALELQAASDMRRFDRAIGRDCASGCTDDATPIDHGLYDKARLEDRVGVGLVVAGLGTVATGAVLLYLNRGRELPVGVALDREAAVVSLRGGF